MVTFLEDLLSHGRRSIPSFMVLVRISSSITFVPCHITLHSIATYFTISFWVLIVIFHFIHYSVFSIIRLVNYCLSFHILALSENESLSIWVVNDWLPFVFWLAQLEVLYSLWDQRELSTDQQVPLDSSLLIIYWFHSGFNDHYQYLNVGTETLFNGVGMGGQIG